MTAAVQPEAGTTPETRTIATIRGDGYPDLGRDPKAMVRYVQRLLADGDADAATRFREATRNLLFADGRQHIDWSLREKTWRDSPTADHQIRVTMNYIRPILRSRAQRLLSAELSWRAIPRNNTHEERDRAAVATNFLDARWRGEDMDAKARQAIFLADNCGVAYFKKFWNPSIGPLTTATMVSPHPITGEPMTYPVDAGGQILADDQGNPLEGTELGYRYRPGDTDSTVRTIFNVRVNPDAQGMQPGEGFRWLIDSEVVPLAVVRERWGARADKVQSSEGVGMMRQYERLVRNVAGLPGSTVNDQGTSRSGDKIPNKDLTLYSEYWEAPTDLMPRGRLIVLAGDELLYPIPGQDEEGLPQGIVPFVAVYSEQKPLDSGGRPVVNDLIAPQRVINAQWGAIIMEQALSGPGQWAMFDIPGLSDQLTNAPAAHIKIPMQSAFANRGIGELVQRINPAQTSPDRWRMVQEAKATMFDIGAFHEIQRGQVPPGVDSGIAVQLLQEAENGQMHDSVRGLKRAFIQWGRLTGQLAKWGYGDHEERWLPQQRPDLDYLVDSITGADLPDFDTIDIDLEGFRPNSQAALNAEIKEAMAQGWIDPRKGLQQMDLGRGIKGAFESQTRHYGRARRENLAIQKQQYQVIPPPPGTPMAALGVVGSFLHPDGASFMLPEDDDHLIHIDVHQEVALDDTRPTEERTAALMHIAEHRAIVRQQLMAQAAAQQDAQGAAGRRQPQDGSQSPKSTPPSSPQGTSDAEV